VWIVRTNLSESCASNIPFGFSRSLHSGSLTSAQRLRTARSKILSMQMTAAQKVKTAAAIATLWSAVVAGSYAVARFQLSPTNLDVEHYTYGTPFVGGGDDIEPRFEEENPLVHIDVPRVTKLSETIVIEVALEENLPSVARLNGEKPTILTYGASASAPGFEIAPSSAMITRTGTGKVDWEWLAKPKDVGEHALRLQFDRNLISSRSVEYLKQERKLDPAMRVSGDSVICSVRVLTSLGLTAGQDAWLKAVGALCGLIGTLLGYPFWKRYLEGRSDARMLQQRELSVLLARAANATSANLDQCLTEVKIYLDANPQLRQEKIELFYRDYLADHRNENLLQTSRWTPGTVDELNSRLETLIRDGHARR
jgi:hypothetical protein